MLTTKFKSLLFISIVGLVCGCTSNDEPAVVSNIAEPEKSISLSRDEVVSIAFDEPQNISQSEAIEAVREFVNGINQGVTSRANNTFTVAKEYRLPVASASLTRASVTNDSITFYDIEDNAGFAVVCADERRPGVVAYIPYGDKETGKECGADMMLDLAQKTALAEIEEVEILRSTLHDATWSKINARLKPSQQLTFKEVQNLIQVEDENELSTRSQPSTSLTSVVTMVAPVATTLWSQEQPYNTKLPQCYMWLSYLNDYEQTYYPAGCGVVAGAQAMVAVMNNNISINGVIMDWEYMRNNPEFKAYPPAPDGLREMVTTLIKAVYDGSGSKPEIDASGTYKPDMDKNLPIVTCSGTDIDKLITYMRNYVTCGAKYNYFAADPILETIRANSSYPSVALMGGTKNGTSGTTNDTHAWVIDGYAICPKSTRAIVKNYDLYFHANMGWGGNNNGFYKVNTDLTISFETSAGNFDHNFWCVTSIHRK